MKGKNQKTKIYLDADDTILESSKTVIEIINERYNISPPKTFDDITDWNYTCIYPGMTSGEVDAIYASEEFFARVEPDKAFLSVYERHKDNFEFVVVTTGTRENLDRKEAWFRSHFPPFDFVGIEFPKDGTNFDKSVLTMKGGIQIDDRVDSLIGTKAACKILIRNGLDVPWNQPVEGANLYVVQNWVDIGQILDFTVKYPNWYKWGGGNI